MAEKSKKEINGSKPENETQETQAKEETPKPKCGIIMPISEIDGCSAEHWGEVLAILQEAIESAGFFGDLVSNSDEISVIHKTIVQNVYNSDIVVCDISGKNPNVMFELGLRLAFDKATIIIKDEATPFSFDTSPIEHLIYPRDLNYHRMNDFKEKLKGKLTATHKKAQSDVNYSPFLKNFGEFRVAKLETQEVSRDVYIVQTLKDLRAEFNHLRRTVSDNSTNSNTQRPYYFFANTPNRKYNNIQLRFDGNHNDTKAENASAYLKQNLADVETQITFDVDATLLTAKFKQAFSEEDVVNIVKLLTRDTGIKINSYAMF